MLALIFIARTRRNLSSGGTHDTHAGLPNGAGGRATGRRPPASDLQLHAANLNAAAMGQLFISGGGGFGVSSDVLSSLPVRTFSREGHPHRDGKENDGVMVKISPVVKVKISQQRTAADSLSSPRLDPPRARTKIPRSPLASVPECASIPGYFDGDQQCDVEMGDSPLSNIAHCCESGENGANQCVVRSMGHA